MGTHPIFLLVIIILPSNRWKNNSYGSFDPLVLWGPWGSAHDPLASFGVGPHEVFEFSGVNLKNGCKIGLKAMVLVAKTYGLP